MSVQELATRDIQEELSRQGKCFIAFQRKLNPIMGKLVSIHIKSQQLCQANSK